MEKKKQKMFSGKKNLIDRLNEMKKPGNTLNPDIESKRSFAVALDKGKSHCFTLFMVYGWRECTKVVYFSVF